MHNKRPWIALLTVGVALSSTCKVSMAVGLASASQVAVLGQSLDHLVAVRLDPGETLTADCVAAEVSVGDRRLPASAVRVLVEPTGADTARLRVQTNLPIDEPVVAVQLSAGCGNRVARRYVLLADPPAPSAATVAVPAYAANLPDAATAAGSPGSSSGAAPAGMTNVVANAALAGAGATALSRAAVRDDGSGPSANSVRRVALRDGAGAGEGTGSRSARRAANKEEAQPTSRAAKRRAAAPAAAKAANAAVARAEPTRRAVRRTAQAGPRLKLDAAVPSVSNSLAVEQALEAVAQAAVAARQSASAASAAADRMAALERTVEQLRGESKASRETAAQLRDQLARAESSSQWTWPLVGVALALGALAAALGLRLSAARRRQDQAWLVAAQQVNAPAGGPATDIPDTESGGRALAAGRGAAKAERTSPVPFMSTGFGGDASPAPAWPPPAPAEPWTPYVSEPAAGTAGRSDASRGAAEDASSPGTPSTTAARLRVVSVPAAPAAPVASNSWAGSSRLAESLSPSQATLPLPVAQRPGESGARDVSIDELLDLEQQAEFFVVLGQDDAAIELLVEHLRNTGGGSPLPYLKLLEIYRRRGDRADYERSRARFNHRFNAYAPEWEIDLQTGRSLEDYSGVLPRLQQVWSRPIDAMAELEALLFRKSRGELFDLPAYREVLFLYAMARDLLDRESADTGFVDVLLPLFDGGDFSSTAPAPYIDMERALQRTQADFEDRPTAPVDLDLSFDSDRPTSIFDPLEERTQPGSRRR